MRLAWYRTRKRFRATRKEKVMEDRVKELEKVVRRVVAVLTPEQRKKLVALSKKKN